MHRRYRRRRCWCQFVRRTAAVAVFSVEVEEDLVQHFEYINVQDQGLCQPKYQQRVSAQAAFLFALATPIGALTLSLP